MKLIIAGSRTIYPDMDLTDMINFAGIIWPDEFVHGACEDGVDKWAADKLDPVWDIEKVTTFPADWKKHGKAAGPIRNKQMAEYADALLVIWDGESRGSKNMKDEMLRLKKPVYEVVLRKYNT